MTYQRGEIVTAADYNNFALSINQLYNDISSGSINPAVASYGYGQSNPIPSVTLGQPITAAQWSLFFQVLHKCATHTGISIGIIPAQVLSNDEIVAYDGVQGLIQLITNLQTNRFNVAGGQGTISTSGTRLLNSRITSWNNLIVSEFTVAYAAPATPGTPTYNGARFFYNTGGQLRIAGARSGGSGTTQNSIWSLMLNSMGTVILDHSTTTITGSAGTFNGSFGFYNLTDSYTTFYTLSEILPDGHILTISLKAKSDGALFGTSGVFRVRCEFSIAIGSGSGSDNTDGTFSVFIDDRLTNGQITLPTPTYTQTVFLADGS
jgi:hypothetical protein